MVKLVDTLASGASALTGVAVQVRPWAPFFLYSSVVNFKAVQSILYSQQAAVILNIHYFFVLVIFLAVSVQIAYKLIIFILLLC